MCAQTKVDSLETVYLKFQIPKNVTKINRVIGIYSEGYINVCNERQTLDFYRSHGRDAGSIKDRFIFNKRKYKPKKITPKDLLNIQISDFNDLEKEAEKEKLYSTPGKLFPNITIVAVEEGKGIFLYEHVKWERTVAIE